MTSASSKPYYGKDDPRSKLKDGNHEAIYSALHRRGAEKVRQFYRMMLETIESCMDCDKGEIAERLHQTYIAWDEKYDDEVDEAYFGLDGRYAY